MQKSRKNEPVSVEILKKVKKGFENFENSRKNKGITFCLSENLNQNSDENDAETEKYRVLCFIRQYYFPK